MGSRELAELVESVQQWKEKGNAQLKGNSREDREGAIDCYTQGLQQGLKAIDDFQGMAEDRKGRAKALLLIGPCVRIVPREGFVFPPMHHVRGANAFTQAFLNH